MRVGLDLQLSVGTATGIGEYARGAESALRSRGIDVVAFRSERLDPWRFDRRVLWDQVALPLAVRRERLDVVHYASGTMPLLTTIGHAGRRRRGAPASVVTVHDVAWLRVQAHTKFYARVYFGTLQLAAYRRADRIVVDSAFSRDELLELSDVDPARVDVVMPGVAADVIALERRPGEGRMVLAVGTVEKRKNLEIVIRALAGTDATLVSAGPPTPYREECIALARACDTKIEFRGYVTRAELLDLYARAAVAVVPSRYEGFGYGAAQALCAGVPLLTARSSSLPEVVAADGELLGADDVSAWREGLARALHEPAAAEARAASVRARASERLGWTASGAALERAYRAATEP